MKSKKREIRIGISGWLYPPWRGNFYPKGLSQKKELAYASREVNSIELNSSFYRLQKPASYEKWYAETPNDFKFSVKANRFITHIKRLNDVDTVIANFFASGIMAFKEKLGPILWQFPPSLKFDAEKFETFLKQLPHDSLKMAAIAKKHDKFVKGRNYTKANGKRPIYHAVEVRNESFKDPKFIKMMKKYNCAIVIAETAGKWPYFEEITADFVYVRLHGDEELYTSGYDKKSLDKWAKKIKSWKGKDTFIYFDNDRKVRAPVDAKSLMSRLKK